MGDVQKANELLCISELKVRRGGGGGFGEDFLIWPMRLSGYVSRNRVYVPPPSGGRGTSVHRLSAVLSREKIKFHDENLKHY